MHTAIVVVFDNPDFDILEDQFEFSVFDFQVLNQFYLFRYIKIIQKQMIKR